MKTADLMHPNEWTIQDIRGWIASEKFDGLRAYWDGSELWTREGFSYHAPPGFTSQLPAIPLDCELYGGPGKRDAIAGIHRAKDPKRWHKLCLMVFDCPAVGGGYLRRIAVARETVRSEFAEVVQTHTLRDAHHAWQLAAEILARHGEGLVAHHPGTWYRPGKSMCIVKIEPACAETPFNPAQLGPFHLTPRLAWPHDKGTAATFPGVVG